MAALVNQALVLTVLMSCLSIYVLSKGKADKFTAEIREYGFKFPYLASMAIYLNEKTNHTSFTRHRRRTRARLADLFGQTRVDIFAVVHHAQKTALSLGLLLLIGVLFALGRADPASWFFGLVLAVLIYYWPDYAIVKQLEQRKRNFLIDLPVFLNTLVLLMNAGLPFSAAIARVVGENRSDRPLFKELRQVLAELDRGKPVTQSYEDLAFRCRVPEITRMVNAILQNIHRGGTSMVYVLMDLGQVAWEKRKDVAKKLGEEASTKLIFPMVMVFAAIAIIVLAPALATMSR